MTNHSVQVSRLLTLNRRDATSIVGRETSRDGLPAILMSTPWSEQHDRRDQQLAADDAHDRGADADSEPGDDADDGVDPSAERFHRRTVPPGHPVGISAGWAARGALACTAASVSSAR
ncbi:hypothetical protein TUSST3_55510 [Streptomyces sp. TUS-ST3]|nr:hypothetical protein TUSST3_55510 [Streptomyces sp. TUS-ST3]